MPRSTQPHSSPDATTTATAPGDYPSFRGAVTGRHDHPPIDPAIEIQQGLDLAELWDRFEIFEALHHTLAVCNPLAGAQLDEVIDRLDPRDGETLVDVACGYGELLARAGARGELAAVGIDLSPWMIVGAHRRMQLRPRAGSVRLVIGDARHFTVETPVHMAVCIGAEWIWHDVGGTARALRALVRPGARVAIGGARLHFDADPDEVARRLGRVETVEDQHARLEACRLRPVARIDAQDAGWDSYLGATGDAALQWAATHPGSRADRWIAEQVDWQQARERDRGVIGWSVWITEAV